jgi:hypothetical protein
VREPRQIGGRADADRFHGRNGRRALSKKQMLGTMQAPFVIIRESG